MTARSAIRLPVACCNTAHRPAPAHDASAAGLSRHHRRNPEPMLQLDAVQTLAFAGMALFLGYALCRFIPVLSRYNLPAPVIGGLAVAIVVLVARQQGSVLFELDTSLQGPLMIAFFTTIGMNASLSLLKISGKQVAVFLVLASAFAVAQNLLGMAIAAGFGLHPLFGVLAGSTTLTGGPATGLAFAPLFEAAGVQGAESIRSEEHTSELQSRENLV